MSKVIVGGEVADLALGYEVKIEDGKGKVSAVVDLAALVEKAESKLPENSLKPIEVAVLEIVKQSIKAL